MRTRSSLIAGAALTCLLAMMGCGSEDDPATVPGVDGSDGNQDGNPGDGDGDGITDDGSDGDTDGDEDGADGTPTDGTDGNPGDGDGDGTPGACEPNLNFVGQCYEKENAPNNGGMETDEPYADSYDSGIAAVLATDVAEGAMATVDLSITGATVTATTLKTHANKEFWLQDAKGALHVRLPADAPVTIVVGSKVSFKVTTVSNYFGDKQVIALSDMTVDSVDQPVFIDDRTGEDIGIADLGKLVRVTGVLSARECTGSTPQNCYTLTHGDKTINVFTGRPMTAAGDCLTFVGPVTSFDKIPQLGGPNWDWSWTNE